MRNVYLDPNSYVYLNNVIFGKDEKYNVNNCREPFIFLQEYCKQRGIHVQTIDFWNSAEVKSTDIYVSFDHKFFLRKMYWKFKEKNYPIVNLNKFKKKILFQFEPPVVMPEIRYLPKHITKMYNTAFFTWKMNNKKANYFHTAQAYSGVFPDYWSNQNRGFSILIQSNRRVLSRYKELLTERVRAILHFAKTQDIDLYGFGWDKSPLFPYWFQKSKIKKVYKGSVEGKYETLSKYTFGFAFENCELPGYTTDKIFDCLYVGTIPIYLGAPDVAEYIPKNCFIHMRDFKNYEELRSFLKSLSQEQVKEYKEQGRKFLESEQYKPFTKEHFAQVFTEAVLI